MLMPIVSMNKMAMNESVAATCCYREKASATNVYWEVLNGGWIGSGYVEKMDLISEHFTPWMQLPYDVTGLVKDGKYYYPAGPNVVIGKRTEPDLSTDDPDDLITIWTIGGVDAELFFQTSSGVYRKGSNCSHGNGGDCKYKVWDIKYLNNQHFSSTTKHDTGGTNWAQPHTSKQFAS